MWQTAFFELWVLTCPIFLLLQLTIFGFVSPQEFDDHRDADDAVYELNGKELCSER